MNFSISISTTPIKDKNEKIKYFSKRDGKEKSTSIWSTIEYKEKEIDLSGLNELISKGYSFCGIFRHTGNILTQTQKTESNFLQTNIISIDADERQRDFNEFCRIIGNTDIMPSLTYTTQDNGIKGNRYRVLYLVDEPITSAQTYKAIYNGLLSEINSHTQDTNGNGDNCGANVAQQMAGNATDTFKSVAGPVYSLAELIERYNVSTGVTCESATRIYNKAGVDAVNTAVTKSDRRIYNNTGVEPVNTFKNESATRIYNKECSKAQDLKVPNGYIIKLIKRRREKALYNGVALLQVDEQSEFLKDYYTLSVNDIVSKYISIYPSYESTFVEIPENELYYMLPADYLEIHRGGIFERVTTKGGNEITIWSARKRKNGEHRRKTLFINLILRRLIYPGITLEHLLFCGLYELYYYIDNDKEDQITKYDIANIAVNAYYEDLTKWEHLKECKKTRYKVNKNYCRLHGLNARREALKLNNLNRQQEKEKQNEQIKALYNAGKTDKENVTLMAANGLQISVRTLKRWREQNGITKYNRNKCEDTANKSHRSADNNTDGKLISQARKKSVKGLKMANMANESNSQQTDTDNKRMKEPKSVKYQLPKAEIKENMTENVNKADLSTFNAKGEEIPTEEKKTQQEQQETPKMTIAELLQNVRTIEEVKNISLEPDMMAEYKTDILPLVMDASLYDTREYQLRHLRKVNYNAFLLECGRMLNDDLVTENEKEEITKIFESVKIV